MKPRVVSVRVGREWRKVVVVARDPNSPQEVYVQWPHTRHISRVPIRWIRRRT